MFGSSPAPRRSPATTFVLMVLITLASFALRSIDLTGVPLRWDEGWSIAHAALSFDEVLRITAQDVHPPLYYLLLKLWEAGAGLSPFAVRMFSVSCAATAAPLCFTVGSAVGGRRAGIFTALAFAWLPLAVYYGAVARMYALTPSFVALAMWGMRRIERRAGVAALTFGAIGAMYTLYHAAWALAMMVVIEVVGSWRKVIVDGNSDHPPLSTVTIHHHYLLSLSLALLAYLPWLLYGVSKLFGRAAAESATNTNQQYGIGYFLSLGIRDLLMTQQAGDAALAAFGALFVAGLLAARRARRSLAPFVLGAGVIGCTLLGVSVAARQWAFNARMLIAALPATAMLIGVAFDSLVRSRIGRAFAAALLLTLAALYYPISTRFVYEKSLEVFDPYSTTTYRENIAPHAQPGDIVIFNVLSPAGFYASQRAPNDPTWTYALTWDPVREPVGDWQARIRTASQTHDRLWLVLYRGLAQNSNNGDLRGWLDSNYFPARAQWGDEEVFYGLYGVADDTALRPGATAQWPDITLERGAVAAQTRPGGILALKLTWRLSAPVTHDYKVFVHVAKPDGFVIGQHDASPLNDLRPFPTLPIDEPIEDRHGVVLPADATGELHVVVGLYDPATGKRLRTVDGRDAVEISDFGFQISN